MSRHLSILTASLIALVSMAIGPQAQATCAAANPNANVIESTPTSAFTDNGNGTVTHNLTGLMWKQCAQGLSGVGCVTGAAATVTWSAALSAAVTDMTAGYNDWRLPNKKELESIVETCGYSPPINLVVFPATPASNFWSATSGPYSSGPNSETNRAWNVYFDLGGTSSPYDKSGAGAVRLVRGGQSFDSFDVLRWNLIFADGFE